MEDNSINDQANNKPTIGDHAVSSQGDRATTSDGTKQVQKNNPLHGVKLQTILEELVAELGWENMGYLVDIRCFNYDPSIKSSLTFLRKTPWARTKVEELYCERILKI